jgi:hypothetical protein
MKSSLGSEVILSRETLSEDSYVAIDLLRAPEITWSAKHCWPIALCRTQTWEITRDEQGYHHLPPTPQLWGTRQTRVTSSLDTTSMLSVM